MNNNNNDCEYYFNQFWAIRNPQIFSCNDLRLALLDIWIECWKMIESINRPESWLSDFCKYYERRVAKGR